MIKRILFGLTAITSLVVAPSALAEDSQEPSSWERTCMEYLTPAECGVEEPVAPADVAVEVAHVNTDDAQVEEVPTEVPTNDWNASEWEEVPVEEIAVAEPTPAVVEPEVAPVVEDPVEETAPTVAQAPEVQSVGQPSAPTEVWAEYSSLPGETSYSVQGRHHFEGGWSAQVERAASSGEFATENGGSGTYHNSRNEVYVYQRDLMPESENTTLTVGAFVRTETAGSNGTWVNEAGDSGNWENPSETSVAGGVRGTIVHTPSEDWTLEANAEIAGGNGLAYNLDGRASFHPGEQNQVRPEVTLGAGVNNDGYKADTQANIIVPLDNDGDLAFVAGGYAQCYAGCDSADAGVQGGIRYNPNQNVFVQAVARYNAFSARDLANGESATGLGGVIQVGIGF